MRDGRDAARRLRAGDRASFDAFYDRFFGPISRYARAHTMSCAAAEAVVEDTLRELVEALLDGPPPGDTAAIAYAIVRRRCAEAVACRPARVGPRSERIPVAGEDARAAQP